MLEAVTTDLVFTISLKRSTQNLQLSTGRRPITPSFGGKADIGLTSLKRRFDHFRRTSLTRYDPLL